MRRTWVEIVLLGAVYLVAARISLSLDAVANVAAAVWPPTGIALAALFVRGPYLWPGVAGGALLANVSSGLPLAVAAGIACGNTLEALIGAAVLRYAEVDRSLQRLRDVLPLLFVAPLCTAVSATIGVACARLGGVVPAVEFGTAWWTWWVGDLMGALVVAPALLVFVRGDWRFPSEAWRVTEATLLIGGLMVTSLAIFAPRAEHHTEIHSIAYALFPFVIWAALRFGQPGAVATIVISSTVATAASVLNAGPFVRESLHESLLLVQTFLAVLTVTGLVLAAVTSDRRRAEAALRKGEERYRHLVEISPDAIVVTGLDGTILLCNEQATQLTGRTAAELIGTHCLAALAPQDHVRAVGTVQETLRRGRAKGVEYSVVRADGSLLAVEVSASVVLEDGEPQAFIAMVRDISARKRMERLRADFMAMLTHDIRSPLANIGACLELLRDEEGLGEHPQHLLAQMESSVRSTFALVTNYLDGTRIEAGSFPIVKQQIRLDALLERLVEQFAVLASQRRIAIDLEMAALPPLDADPIALERIFANLLHNALKFSPENSRVVVRAGDSGHGSALVSIRDSGPGISADEIPLLFQPYRQTNEGRKRKGTGLGLFIARYLVEGHGGTIHVENGVGTCFTVELPLQNTQAEPARA